MSVLIDTYISLINAASCPSPWHQASLFHPSSRNLASSVMSSDCGSRNHRLGEVLRNRGVNDQLNDLKAGTPLVKCSVSVLCRR